MSFKKYSAKAKAAGLAIVAIGSNAMAGATVTVPTPDYTTFYSVVGVGLAVTLIVGLARKSKSFLR